MKLFKKASKYFNHKTKQGDSKVEVKRYNELLYLEKIGLIKEIVKQPSFTLQEGFRYKPDERKEMAITYTPDFQYFDITKNKTIIEEIKGKHTKRLSDYSIRRRLLKYTLKDRDDIEFIEIVY